jgi:hypothetical protein
VRRWTPTVLPPSGREANEAALVKRELVALQRRWLRAIDASSVYLRAVAASRPTSAPFSALVRAYRTARAMESRLRTEWGGERCTCGRSWVHVQQYGQMAHTLLPNR